MATEWFGKFIDNLARLLKEPPYLLFVFIGGIFVVITLISQKYFVQSWTFFLYSVGGTIWRYAERDFLGMARDNNKKNLKIISQIVYHLGNIALFLILLHYLKFA